MLDKMVLLDFTRRRTDVLFESTHELNDGDDWLILTLAPSGRCQTSPMYIFQETLYQECHPVRLDQLKTSKVCFSGFESSTSYFQELSS